MNSDDMNEHELELVIEEISRRSIVDPEFRELALRDPAAAAAKFSKKTFPQGVRFLDVSSDASRASQSNTI